MCEDKFEQYMKEERRYLYERINLLISALEMFSFVIHLL
jgi:hypothetical protein